MNVKQSLFSKFEDGSFALLTDAEISRRLRLGRREARAVREFLFELTDEGKLYVDSRSRFGTAQQFGAKKGKFTGNERGFGFFTPDDGSGDLFIPRRACCGALHGDSVLAFPLSRRSGDEGEILSVLSRGYAEIVGVYRAEGRAGILVPDERKYCAEIAIPRGKDLRCPDGSKAVARILSYKDGFPVGEITEILGADGDFFVEEAALIRAHKLKENFPADVLAEAERAERRGIPPSELAGREDLRGMLIITVDGEDTRDIDDAISLTEQNGVFSLGVHIADVSRYVPAGSALDREAFARGTSVYFPDRVLPMLPKALSNGICSLNEGEDRLALSCFMTVDAHGKVLKKRISPTVIRSAHRMTYTDVAAIAEGKKEAKKRYPDLVPFVKTAVKLTGILKRARDKRGAPELDLREVKILYENGTISIPACGRTVAHEMIEQFMVLANESVAEIMTEKGAPFVYRVHERPAEEKAENLLAFARGLGLDAAFRTGRVAPSDYRDLLKRAEGPLRPIVSRVMLRSMAKAKYSPENLGHFGLASPCYCHFTSPIRRYPDLAVHRIIRALAEGTPAENFKKFAEEAAVQASECERRAAEAERDVDDLYIAAFMEKRIGEEDIAVISGVQSFGLFAELGNTVEGFIPIETLPDDFYTFDESRYTLCGLHHVFRLGERIGISVDGVDYGNRRVQFRFLGKEQEHEDHCGQ